LNKTNNRDANTFFERRIVVTEFTVEFNLSFTAVSNLTFNDAYIYFAALTELYINS